MALDPALPEGTVTVLSTDLVGSTALNQRLGDVAGTTLERELTELARAQVEKHRGVVITQAGDRLMVAFQSARRAVACAQDSQRGVARLNRSMPEVVLKLRVGLHTGHRSVPPSEITRASELARMVLRENVARLYGMP